MADGSSTASPKAPVKVTFTPDPGFDVLFDNLHAEEELGKPFLFQLDVSSGKQQTNVYKLIGSTCSIFDEPAE